MSELTERQLLILAQESLPYDTRFYEQLVKPYISMLKAYCSRILNDIDEAEDAVQEVLIKALKNLKSFKWNPSFKAWLFRIAHNECIDRIRQRQVTEEFTDTFEVEPADDDNDFDAILADLIQHLSLIDKNILLLRYRTGLEFQEIADICDLKLSAVKMRHKRMLEQLKQQYESIKNQESL